MHSPRRVYEQEEVNGKPHITGDGLMKMKDKKPIVATNATVQKEQPKMTQAFKILQCAKFAHTTV
jgi:phosphoribosylaminoimidazole (AIR) synthetase